MTAVGSGSRLEYSGDLGAQLHLPVEMELHGVDEIPDGCVVVAEVLLVAQVDELFGELLLDGRHAQNTVPKIRTIGAITKIAATIAITR